MVTMSDVSMSTLTARRGKIMKVEGKEKKVNFFNKNMWKIIQTKHLHTTFASHEIVFSFIDLVK